MVRVDENNYCTKRNTGARATEAKLVAYIDDDIVLSPNWVKAVIRGFKKDWKMAGGPVEPRFESVVPDALKGFERYIGGFNCYSKVGYATPTVVGCNMFFDRNWLLESGGFDLYIGRMNDVTPRVFYGGDETDVQARLHSDQVGFIPDASVSHVIQNDRMQVEFVLDRAKGMGRARYYIDSKNGIHRNLFLMRFYFLLRSLVEPKKRLYYRRRYNYITGYYFQKRQHG